MWLNLERTVDKRGRTAKNVITKATVPGIPGNRGPQNSRREFPGFLKFWGNYGEFIGVLFFFSILLLILTF